MKLTLRLGNADDLEWGQQVATHFHYLHRRVHRQARPMVYVVEHNGEGVGLCMVGLPHATKCRGWWGYPGTPTQWQVVDLSRIYLFPELQHGGPLCKPGIVPGFTDRAGVWRPKVATWVIDQVLAHVQMDRVAMYPPVFLGKPYHIRLAISYHDPQFHKGTIYRQSGALPVYVDENGTPIPGPSGKYLWAWRLPEPEWGWQDISILRPRTLRMFA